MFLPTSTLEETRDHETSWREEKLQKKRHFSNSTLTAPPPPLPPPDCSQSPVFREIVKIEGLPVQTAILISYVPRGRGLDHPRWPPITQSARSRRPKGKIGGRARANDFPRHLLLNVTHIKREMSEQESVHNQHN